MVSYSTNVELDTKGEGDVVLLDNLIHEAIASSTLSSGIVTIFVPGSTGAVTTIEYETGLKADLPAILAKLIPQSYPFKHNEYNHDDNGHSHVKAAVLGPSLTIPFIQGNLTLGTWQQVVFLEFDTRPRSRRIEVMIIGD